MRTRRTERAIRRAIGQRTALASSPPVGYKKDMRAFWNDTPRLAKSAFALGAISIVYLAVFWTSWLFVGPEASRPSVGDAVMAFVLTAVPAALIVGVIGVGLRSDAAGMRRVAGLFAGVVVLFGVWVVYRMLFPPASVEWSLAEEAVWGGLGIIALGYAPFAYLGFSTASRLNRRTTAG